MLSLRRRAIIGGALSGALMLLIGFFLLSRFVDNLAQSRFDTALQDRHLQVVVALSNAPDMPSQIGRAIGDPAYQRPLSGRYWQITGPQGQVLTSRSLLDELLLVPEADAGMAALIEMPGPDGTPIRMIDQRVILDDGSAWRVSVAHSLSSLEEELSLVRLSLLQGFALLGLLGIAAAIFQITAVLAPLRKLRHDVSKRWSDGAALDPGEYPEEVAPLVTDINTLLDRNRDVVDRARRQAADLAHALKTPCAIMRNELEMLSMQSIEVAQAQEALDRVDAQLGRSLARIRAANSAASTHSLTDLNHSIDRFARLFRGMAEGQGKTFGVTAQPDLRVRMDRQDIEEVLGNLLDNALKWCRNEVRLSAGVEGNAVVVEITDDGPGIPEDAQREALRAGGRLDSSTPGTGLGLAIAVDLLRAYGGTIKLRTADSLGGLSVLVRIPNGLGLAMVEHRVDGPEEGRPAKTAPRRG